MRPLHDGRESCCDTNSIALGVSVCSSLHGRSWKQNLRELFGRPHKAGHDVPTIHKWCGNSERLEFKPGTLARTVRGRDTRAERLARSTTVDDHVGRSRSLFADTPCSPPRKD